MLLALLKKLTNRKDKSQRQTVKTNVKISCQIFCTLTDFYCLSAATKVSEGLKLFKITLIWTAISATIFFAEASSAGARVFGDWSVSCSAGEPCLVSQSLMGEDRTWLATVRLMASEGRSASVQFIVPAGVHLASGIYAAVGEESPLSGQWISCSSEACLATADMTPAAVTAWKRAMTAELRYRTRPDGPVVRFPISLVGLTAALRDVENVSK